MAIQLLPEGFVIVCRGNHTVMQSVGFFPDPCLQMATCTLSRKLTSCADNLVGSAMSQGGDSGSAVLDEQNRLTGLLFAGSEQSTIINRIENVFDALDLTL